ncbi:HAD-IA family hydrolase [Candidatus Woesearchaeota archaeon]|nr:HAD-IA family hydrolase [Candidatus Woesearchaeota archaeon]
MKKTIIFDFDGTIADTFFIAEEIGNKYAKKYSIAISSKEARELGLKTLFLKLKFPLWRIPVILAEFKRTIALKLDKKVTLFDGMREVLHQLSKKHQLGIASTNSEESINRFLAKYRILELFKFISSNSSIFGKHRALKRLCKKYNLPYKDVIYIGDEDRDVRAAKKLGIKVIAVSWGYNSKRLLEKEKPDYIADKPRQILNILGS